MTDRITRTPTKLILKGTPDELAGLTAKKLQLLVAHYKTDLPMVCEPATFEECRQFSPLARSLVMLIVFGTSGMEDEEVIVVATSRAMMKAIASISENSVRAHHSTAVSSPSVVDEAVIDGWLSFIWNSIDLPFQTAMSLLEDDTHDATTTAAELEGIEEDLKIALKTIENHLAKQESRLALSKERNGPLSIAGSTYSSSAKTLSYSLADLSLAVTIHFMMEKDIAVSTMSNEENPHLYSWKQNIHRTLGFISGAS